MTSETAMIDLAALRRGVQERDLNALLSLYDDNAEVSVVDQRHTPSRPQVFRGKREISSFLSELLGREMTHEMDHLVAGDGTVSYTERCTYPDGSRVTAATTLDVAGSRIVREEVLQAWDEPGPAAGSWSFENPDEIRTFGKGRLELLHTPAGDVGRMVLEPGWRWSEHVKPIAGTGLCQQSHFGYQISGTLRIQMADGTVIDARPGQVEAITPGHDAWVVGDETVVLLDWLGAATYAK
jgi:hypothetical protein